MTLTQWLLPYQGTPSVPPPSAAVEPQAPAAAPPSTEAAALAAFEAGSPRAHDSALPARRVVPFSDVPVAGAVVTRPTETTTARSAFTAAVRAPSRQQWSLIGGAALVLILLIVVVASLGGDDDAEAEAGTADTALAALPAVPPPPVPAATQPKRATTVRAPKAKKVTSTKRSDKPVRAPAPVGQAVDLEELPVLSADASPATSTRSGATTTRRSAPKTAAKTDANIFNQAKNLAQKRATQRSGSVKTGSGD